MLQDILDTAKEKMKKSCEVYERDMMGLRAGRANPKLLDRIMVDYYGTPTPVNQVAKVSVPEPRMIVIQPWEKTLMKELEKAILKSELGLTPNSDGNAIRLTIPQLTKERREELKKTVNKKAEEAKVALRNLRRDANEAIKKLEKNKEIAEDDSKKGQEDMQKLVDKYVKMVDSVKAGKEKEIMEV